ncbi:hypothetical protein H9P43_006620 [Blastocladiella emersonii ATCC 22665]|nr:hypothetical protein H9P43_006620 [Blastocladiella emersonii ATCC 22665]
MRSVSNISSAGTASTDGKVTLASGPSRGTLEIQATVRDTSTSTLPLAHAGSASLLKPSSLMSVASPSKSTRPRRGRLEIVLTRSFKSLTAIMIFEWLAILVLVPSPLPVRASSVSSFIASLMAVTEASFDWLLRQNHEREEI